MSLEMKNIIAGSTYIYHGGSNHMRSIAYGAANMVVNGKQLKPATGNAFQEVFFFLTYYTEENTKNAINNQQSKAVGGHYYVDFGTNRYYLRTIDGGDAVEFTYEFVNTLPDVKDADATTLYAMRDSAGNYTYYRLVKSDQTATCTIDTTGILPAEVFPCEAPLNVNEYKDLAVNISDDITRNYSIRALSPSRAPSSPGEFEVTLVFKEADGSGQGYIAKRTVMASDNISWFAFCNGSAQYILASPETHTFYDVTPGITFGEYYADGKSFVNNGKTFTLRTDSSDVMCAEADGTYYQAYHERYPLKATSTVFTNTFRLGGY